MHPILIRWPDWIPFLGTHFFHTYGLLYALGFFLGYLWIRAEGKRLGYHPAFISDLFFYIVLASVLGARLFYFVISYPDWWKHPLDFFKIWEGGLVFYGGLICAVLVSYLFCKKKRVSFFEVADIFAPGIALGHAIGRLGCFSAGCCYGRSLDTTHWYTIIFPQVEGGIAPHGIPLYATQIYEALALFLIFMFLISFRKQKKFNGQIFLIYAILYSLVRSVLEIFRGDSIRGFVIDDFLSTSQLISLGLILICLILWKKLPRKE